MVEKMDEDVRHHLTIEDLFRRHRVILRQMTRLISLSVRPLYIIHRDANRIEASCDKWMSDEAKAAYDTASELLSFINTEIAKELERYRRVMEKVHGNRQS